MGASCSSSRSLSSRGSGAGDDVSAQQPHRCIPHSHRTAQHASSPYPKSPLYRLHALLPSSPFPCLNGLLRLKHCSLRIDPVISSSTSSSSSASVSSVSAAALQAHLYVNVVHSTDGICELMSKTPVGSFALYVIAQPHQRDSQQDKQTLSVRIAYHYQPRRDQYGHQQLNSSATSTRQSSLTFVNTALTAFQLTLSRIDSSCFLIDQRSRAETAADSFPSGLYTARLPERAYRQLERVCFVFLPRLRQLLLDAARHPAFVPPQPALVTAASAASIAAQLSAAYHESFPLSLSAHTDRHRSGLLLTFAASDRRFHLDVDWRREQPRLHCKELSLTIADCDDAAHSLPCFVSRAWAAVSGSRSVDHWKALMLDLFALSAPPLFTAADSKSLQPQSCCAAAAAPHCSSPPVSQAAGSPFSDIDAVASPSVASPKSSLDRRFLVSFLREYAVHYAGGRMLESVVIALQPQTLLTPKRGSATAAPAATKNEEGEERRMKQSVQDMLLKVMEAVRSIATMEEAARPQWSLDVTDALLHILCLHAAHHRLTATALSVLQVLRTDSSAHYRMLRMINAHLAAHPLCQGVLLALWSLLSSDAAFCLSAPMSTLRCLLSVHSQACIAMLPPSAFASSSLPSLPPQSLTGAAAASLSSYLPLDASAACPASPAAESSRRSAPKAVPPPLQTSTRQRSASAYPSSMRAALQPKQPNASAATVRSISFRAKQPATILALTASPRLALATRKRTEAEEEKSEQQQQGVQAALTAIAPAVETPKAGAVKGILKTAPALLLRQPTEAPASDSEEAADARLKETRPPGDADTAAFSPLQRQATLRPSKSALRLLEKRGKMDGGEPQEEKETSSTSATVIVSTASGSPSRSVAATVVIPKLRLSLALGAQGGGSSLPAPLTSMRHSRRATRRTELSSSRLGRAEQQQQTFHMLSPTALQSRPFFPSTFSPPPAAARRPSHAHRFSVLDPELPVSSLAVPATSRRQLDAETRAALRRLREVAMGAGESFVTSQLSCILWHRRQLSPADLALLGWDGLSAAGSAASAAAASSAQSFAGNGERRKERLSASSSHWQLQLLSSASSADSGRDAWTAAVAESSSCLRAGDAPLFHCAVLALRCIQSMMAVQEKQQRRDRRRCLTSELAALNGSLSWLVRGGGAGPNVNAASTDVALLRLPAAHLRYYRQALCDAIHAASSASFQPASQLPLPCFWRLRVRLHGSLQSLPLLTTAGLKLPFPRSFASLDAVCLLPSTAQLVPAPQQQTSVQHGRSSTCAPKSAVVSEEADGSEDALPAAAVVESGADGFYAEMAERLQAQVSALSRLQAFTAFPDAVEVLSQTANTVQALHLYTIHADCTFGIQPAFASASASTFSLPQAFESLPAFATSCRSDFSCACGVGVAQLLRSCGGCLIDLHGQLSRLYRLCKEQAVAAARACNAPPPRTNSGVSALQKQSSSSDGESARKGPSCPPLLEIHRLTTVNALLSLWVSLLSHPSSQAVHELLLRLLRDPTSLPDDATHEQLRYGAANVGGGLQRRSGTVTEKAMVEQKVALFSLLQFAHDHAILVYAASASSYCLLVQPARRQPDAAFHSQRLSRATTLPPQQTLSSRQISSSMTGRDSIAASAAQTPQSQPEESDDDTVGLPSALHPAVHSARVLVLAFYRAAAWLLQRAGDVAEQPEEQNGNEPTEAQPGRDRAISAAQSGRSSRDSPIADGGESSQREQSDDADTQREPEDSPNYEREDSFSSHHLRADRRTQQRARARTASIAPAASARAAADGATERPGELSWFWSTLSDALHGPHGLIARALQLLIANDSVTVSAEDEDEACDSEDDTHASVDSSSSMSSTAASADELSEDSAASVSSACSRRLLARRVSEFDLLSAYCALWSDLLGWRGAAVCAVCPWLQDDRLMDGLVRLHFVAFVRNYHTSLAFDGLRAATCSLHIAVLRAVAQSPSRILHSVSLSPADRQQGGHDGRHRSEPAEDADPSDAAGASSFSQAQLQSQAEAISGCFLRLRVLHFLSRELNAEHDTFVARSYLAAGLAAATAGNTAANTARSIAGFSPRVGTQASAVDGPATRSRGHSPLPSMQLDTAAAVFAPLSPHFNLSKAMSSVLTLQSFANSGDDGTVAVEILSPSHPLPALSAALPAAAAPHGEHRRSASSPVHLGQQESLPPLSEAPSALSLGPSFLLAAEPTLGTPVPLSTHHEEELEEQQSQLSLRCSMEGDAGDGGDNGERQQDDDDDDDEDDCEASVDSTLQEETAVCRVHADEADPLFDAASEPASRVNSRTDKDGHRPTTGDSSAAQQRSSVTETQQKAEAALDATAAETIKEGSDGETAEDGEPDNEDEEGWDYSASELSVSTKRANPLDRLLLPLPVEQTAEAEQSVAGDGEGEDEDAEYEASDVSSAADDAQSSVARPRFQLSLAPAASQSRQGSAEQQEEKDDTEQPAEQEEPELDGWSDSESSQRRGSARGSGQQDIRLQLIIPTASTSSSPSPSASLSQSQGGSSSELKPTIETQLALPAPPRLSLHSLPSSAQPSRRPSVSASAPPELRGSGPPQPTANVSLPLVTAVEGRNSHSRTGSIVGRPSVTLPALLPLGRLHSQPLLASPQLLDASLPGMTGAATDSPPPPAMQPFLAPPSLPLRSQHSGSISQTTRALLRSTSSPHHRPSLNPLAAASASPATLSDDSYAPSSYTSASLPAGGRLSVRGRSMVVKTVSAHDQYARQRQQRRFYSHPALHLDILRLLLRLLVDPSDDCLSSLYCDRAVTAAAAKADADVDVLSSLHAHLNHPSNAAILPPLFASSLSPHRSPMTRLLKLLVEQLFPSSLFLQPSATQIGRGQFAQVYVARLPGLQQTVAVKQIDASSSAHQRVVLFDLFTEVSVMQRMRQHEGVVQLYEYGVSRGQFYLVMKAASKSLKAWRDELDKGGWGGRAERASGGKRWAAKEVVSPCFTERQLMLFLLLFRRVLAAMSALHAASIVHFDLKLDNVLLDMAAPADPASWSVCLADFGESLSLQHSAAGGSSISRGTENIQSPEMLLLTQVMDSGHHAFDRRRNNVVGAASDVWSLGCLFFELLTNRMLFEAAHGLPIVLRVTGAAASSSASTSLLSEADQALLGSFGGRPNRCLLRFLSSVLVQNKDRRPTLRKVQRLFEQMVDELFPRGLLPDGDGLLLLDPPAASRAPGRNSVVDAAGKRVSSRSFSVQLEASASSSLPTLAFRTVVEQPVSFRAEEAQTPPLATSASRARRIQRFTSSRRLSAASNASPLALHYSPLSDELKLPTHSVLAALSVGARHGKAASMQAQLYFQSSGIACTHLVHVRPRRAEAKQDNVSQQSAAPCFVFYGWQQQEAAAIAAPLTSSAAAASVSGDESLNLLSAPSELDACVLFIRDALALGGRVLLFVDADERGSLSDEQQDSLRGLCCGCLMAVYGLRWVEAASIVHEKLPVAALPVEPTRNTAAVNSPGSDAAGAASGSAQPRRLTLFRPSVVLTSASAAPATRPAGLSVSGAKLNPVFAHASVWALRVAASLHSWASASAVVVNPTLPASYLRFITATASRSVYSTYRCLCGSCLLTCSTQTADRSCSCCPSTQQPVSASSCPTAPLGCRWHAARIRCLFGETAQPTLQPWHWKVLLDSSNTATSSPPPASSQSTNGGQPSSHSAADNRTSQLSLLPYCQLAALQHCSLHPAATSPWLLFECQHCLYPLLAVLPTAPSSPPAGPPSLRCDESGAMLCDGVAVRGLQLLAGVLVSPAGGASRSAPSSSSAADDEAAFLFDRRPRAFYRDVA